MYVYALEENNAVMGPNEKGKQKPMTVHLSYMYSHIIMKNNKKNKK